MKKLILTLAMALVCVIGASAQSKEDLIKVCDIFLETPLSADESANAIPKQAGQILIQWVTVSSDYQMEMSKWAMRVMPGRDESDADNWLFPAYIAGELRYSLFHDLKQSTPESVKAAILSVMQYYDSNKDVLKKLPKNFKKFIKMNPEKQTVVIEQESMISR